MVPLLPCLRALLLLLCCLTGSAWAQDQEPRRWTHLPTGLNVIGVALGATTGDIFFDPVLKAEDVEFEQYSTGFVYLRTFGMLGRSARLDVRVPYARGRWEGFLDGVYTSTRRSGFGDPRLRLSMLLYGGRAETREEFAVSQKSNTVVGAAISVTLPWGDYREDKLLNLGANGWVLRPQLGVTHSRKRWTFELSGSAFLYGDNNDFWNGQHLEKDTLWALQGHVIHTFKPGLWASVSMAYGSGADVTVDDVPSGQKTGAWLSAINFGLPITRTQGIKFSLIRWASQEETGRDSHTLLASWTHRYF